MGTTFDEIGPAASRRKAAIAERRRWWKGVGVLAGVAGAMMILLSGCDTTPPGPVSGVSSTPAPASVTLDWTNPEDADFAGVLIRVVAGGTAPATATAGSFVADVAAPATSVVATGLAPSTTYSFALFAHDAVPNDAAPVTITVTTGDDGLACTKTWKGPGNGSFAMAANWLPVGVPGAGDTVCSPSGSSIVSSVSQTVAATRIGGAITIRSSFTITGTDKPNTIASLAVGNGGRLSGSETITSTLDWTGGFLANGATPGVTTIPVGATATVHPSAPNSVDLDASHTLVNRGTLTQTSDSHDLFIAAGGQLQNFGTYNLDTAGTSGAIVADGTGGSVVNEPGATIDASLGAGLAMTITVPFDNAGLVNVASGTLTLTHGNIGTDTDTGTVTGSGTLYLGGGTRTFAPKAVVVVANLKVASAGTAVFNAQTIPGLSLGNGGTQLGNLTITGTLDWTGGFMSGAGSTTTIKAGATAAVHPGSATSVELDVNHTLVNRGTLTQTSSALRIDVGGQLENFGTYNLDVVPPNTHTTNPIVSVTTPPGLFVNESGATFAVDIGAGNTANIRVSFNNLGTIDVRSGTLVLL